MVTLLIGTGFAHPAYAGETGGSSYPPGTFGDFAMNSAPVGLHAREWIIYTDRSLKKAPVQPGITTDVDSSGWSNLLTVAYVSDTRILGGNYAIILATPWVYDVDLKARTTMPGLGTMESHAGVSGLMDAHFFPLAITWNFDTVHLMFAQNVVLPTGRYDASRPSAGRNYMSYDPIVGFTWLDQERGHEISFTAGYMINTKNRATGYRTGNEFHVDYNLNQFLSRRFGIGIAGWYYRQMTDDESPVLDQIDAYNRSAGLPTLDGYRSRGAAAGPSLLFSTDLFGRDISFSLKWLHEYYARNRLEGDWIYLSTIMSF